MFILGDAIVNYTSTGTVMERQGNSSGSASPRGIYQAGDGKWLSIAASNQSIAMRLFDSMERPDLKTDERYATNAARMENNDSLQEIVRVWVRSRPRAEVLDLLDRGEVVAAAVNDSSDVVADPHFAERTLVELANTALGTALVPGPVLHVSGYAGPAYDGVPRVGEHTHEVLESLGLSGGEIADLRTTGVVTA
jgi:crotonobetainyl-CoA:carnitine CoA-transferase CaiB-like acyl-CoA transferase